MFSRRKVFLGLPILALSACSSSSTPPLSESTTQAGIGPSFSSVDELAAKSAFIFSAHITRERGRKIDDGGLGREAGGIPMVFYTATVAEAFRGGLRKGERITVAWLDQQGEDGATPLGLGDDYVFFAERVVAQDAPGIAEFAPAFVPLGGDDGVLDLSDGRLQPHGESRVRQLRLGDASPADSWTLSDVRAAITDHS